ncbi:hypothetical protein ABZ702_36320 [Streptomyces cyaneofuscatus]|uniref:hypothetical protein n=1 Tax=Streptomyces cyaneofuscatus TaxID=66883 RepID=UPI0033EF1A3D
MSDLQEEATVSAASMRLPLLGGRIAEEGTDSTAQRGHGIVEFRTGGCTQMEREDTPYLTLCLLRIRTRHGVGGAVRAGSTA